MRDANSHWTTLCKQMLMVEWRTTHNLTAPSKPPPPQVGQGRVDHHRIITCSEGKITVAMETPFRNPMILGTHAAFSLICPNSYWSILRFAYECWKTLTLINTQCAAVWMSRIIKLKGATLTFTSACIGTLLTTAKYRICIINNQHFICINQ